MKTQRPASGKRPSLPPANGNTEVVSDNPTNGAANSSNGNGNYSNGNGHPSAALATGSIGTLPVRAANRSSGNGATAVLEAPVASATVELEPAPVVVDIEEVEAPPAPRSWLTLENGAYILIFILALATRFLDLGDKALHHDESLHAVFSWRYYVDQGYIHSPMMHGPEQFHFIDFFYLLFGATDATVRFASATCGVFIVMAPLFLRRQIGRWPALIASFLFLVSPGFMYFTRFAREDSIYAAMEMLFMVGLWRFIDGRKPRDFYIACAGYALMFTIKETAYLTTLVLGALLVGLFAWQVGRWLFATFIAYGVAAGGMAVLIMKLPGTPALPSIPATDPTPQNIQDFVTGLIGHPLIQVTVGITVLWLAVSGYMLWDQSRRIRRAAPEQWVEDETVEETPEAPAMVARVNGNGAAHNGNGHSAELDGEFDGEEDYDVDGEAAPVVVQPQPRRRAVPARAQVAVPGLLERYPEGSIPYAIGYLVRNPEVLGIGLGLAVFIYVALYTSLFSNINGLGTGLFGSIGYWIAQQGVARGGQPWFYYIILLPIYEILPIIFGFAAMIMFAIIGVKTLLSRRKEEPAPAVVVPGATAGFNVGKPVPFSEIRPFMVLFLSVWFIGIFFLYCWAGEKMPWLIIHMDQPLIFLSGIFLGAIITAMIRYRREREIEAEETDIVEDRRSRVAPVPLSPLAAWSHPSSFVPFVSYLSVFVLLSALWGMNVTSRVASSNYANWWQLAVWPALMIVVTAIYWNWIGRGRVMRYLAVGVFAILLAYTVRSAINLSFYNPDTATELAIYVQSSPDVTRVADTLDRLSVDQTGKKDLKVMYDSLASWPWEWYLRDYSNKVFNPDGPTTAPASDVAVIIADSKFYDQQQAGTAPQLANYVGTKYPMRWWFPEETYRDFVPDRYAPTPVAQAEGFIGTIIYTLGNPTEQGKLWNYLVYRRPYAALGSTDMSVFVRKDLVNRYNFLASLDLPNYENMAK